MVSGAISRRLRDVNNADRHRERIRAAATLEVDRAVEERDIGVVPAE